MKIISRKSIFLTLEVFISKCSLRQYKQRILGSSASYLQNSLFAFAVLVFKLFRSRAIRECEYVENCSDAVINCNFVVNKCFRISLDVFA